MIETPVLDVTFVFCGVQSTGIQTDRTEKILFSASVNQWRIFDTYKRYEEVRDQREREDEKEEEEPAEDTENAADVKPSR